MAHLSHIAPHAKPAPKDAKIKLSPFTNKSRLSHIKIGIVDSKTVIERLFNNGYEKVSLVNKTGEFAVRGFVIDVFPLKSENPIRIEFWGDTIESIKEFDISNQRTIKDIKDISIFPNTEFITNDIIDKFGLRQSELSRFENTINISDYNETTVFYNNFSNIKNAHLALTDEIYNYAISSGLNADYKFMYNLNELIKNDHYFFEEFDVNEINKISYDAKKIENFVNPKNEITSFLKTKLKKNKIIICASDRYKANKILDYFDNEKIVLTNEDEIGRAHV